MPLKEKRTMTLITAEDIAQQLRTLGVEAGMTLLVHSSLSKLAGYVCGAELAVIHGLMSAVSAGGTLLMPAHSSVYSDPKFWVNPPVPTEWWPKIRETMPVFTPETAPVRGVGRIPACFAVQPSVVRSAHPSCSFAAWGQHAAEYVAEHRLAFGFGESSPLATLYNTKSSVLFLGAPFESNTSLHVSEIRAQYPGRTVIRQGAPMLVNGSREWVEFAELDYDSDDFEEITRAFIAQSTNCKHGKIGDADAWILPIAEMVDYGVWWMNSNRR